MVSFTGKTSLQGREREISVKFHKPETTWNYWKFQQLGKTGRNSRHLQREISYQQWILHFYAPKMKSINLFCVL